MKTASACIIKGQHALPIVTFTVSLPTFQFVHEQKQSNKSSISLPATVTTKKAAILDEERKKKNPNPCICD